MTAPSDIKNPYVILPWAQASSHDSIEHVFHSITRQRVQDDVHAAKVRSTNLPTQSTPTPPKQQPVPQKAAESASLAPPLGTLPYSPLPEIPETDRPLYVQEELLSVAVALDVLSTSTRSLEHDETILSKLTETLVTLGHLSGATDIDHNRLLSFARSPAGETRQRLAVQLSEAMEETRQLKTQSPRNHPATANTPEHIGLSLESLEHMADQAILEAYLLIESRPLMEYKQA